MRDTHLGGLLAFAIAAPVVFVCCGAGGAVLAAIPAVLVGWFAGLGGIYIFVAALAGVLLVRELRRHLGRRTVDTDR